MKDGKREFPPYNETVQRAWTLYKLLTHDLDPDSPYFWTNWVQRAELNTHSLFLSRKRRFPESQEEYEDEHSGELLLVIKSKVRAAGDRAGPAAGGPFDLTWSQAEGFVFHRIGVKQKITLTGPVPGPHPFAGVE